LLESDEPYPLMIAKLDSAPMLCRSGDCYAYQNVAFSLVGDMAFAVTGDFFSPSGREEIVSSARECTPRRMVARHWKASRKLGASARDAGWSNDGGPREGKLLSCATPAAGVNASARDLTQWLLGNLAHQPGGAYLPRIALDLAPPCS
jgi:beta-lactamase class C